MNTTARLASAAAAGEELIAEATARDADLDVSGLAMRELHLKGKTELVRVFAETRHRRYPRALAATDARRDHRGIRARPTPDRVTLPKADLDELLVRLLGPGAT